MDRFLHWDRDKGCIIIIEQRKVDFALWCHRASQMGGKHQEKKGGQRTGDHFSWRKKTASDCYYYRLFFVHIQQKFFFLMRGGLHTTFFPQSPPSTYIQIAHTHSDDYAHSMIHKSFRIYLSNIRPSTMHDTLPSNPHKKSTTLILTLWEIFEQNFPPPPNPSLPFLSSKPFPHRVF